jgi:uncharacterized protein (DUF58 family)
MESTETKQKTQLTALLANDVLARVERMRLNPTRRLTNRSRGEHLSRKGGASTEFVDYRDYSPGDDVRYIDWNIFSRLNRPYMKQFRHEEEMHVVVIIDASSSMVYDGKLERAKQLAAALAVMGLMNLERVSVYACHRKGDALQFVSGITGRISIRRLFEFLENIETGGDFAIDEAVESVLRQHTGRGIAILLSDFFTFGGMERSLNFLFSAGLEVFGIQILAPAEISPDVTGDLRFVDCENGATLDVSSAGELLGIYQEHRLALQERIESLCRSRNGRFLSISSHDPLPWVLFDLLRRRGWIR